MSTATAYPHLTLRPDGTVHLGNTRYKVVHLAAEHYFHGWTAEELLRQHPDLRPEQVYSALAYFYDNFDDLVATMKTSADGMERAESASPFSREELLERKAVKDD